MLEFQVLLDTVDKVKRFVQTSSRFPYEVDVLSGRYVVDGKSIMGIFSFHLQEPLTVRVHGETADDLLAALGDLVLRDE